MLTNTGDAIISADEKDDIEFINQAALKLCRKNDLSIKTRSRTSRYPQPTVKTGALPVQPASHG